VDHSTTGAPVHGPVAENRTVGASDGLPAVVTDGEVHPRREDGRYHLGSAEEASSPRMVEPFEDFMRRERKPVVGLLYGLSRDWYAAEDLAQNAFEAAQRHWPRVSRLDKPGAWLRRVAINGLRRWQRRGLLEAEALAQKFLMRYDQQVELPAEHAELWDAVRRLPRVQREVVVLHYQSDLAVAEIAEILGIRDGTVKSRLHYARKALAKWLRDDTEGGLQ
jgi:RNA polymerase sigma-70 factor (ECF subfamily)